MERSDPLLPDPLLTCPIVRVHIVDPSTGEPPVARTMVSADDGLIVQHAPPVDFLPTCILDRVNS